MTRFHKVASATALLLVAALVAGACSKKNPLSGSSGNSQGTALTGAGATFPDPIYEKWFKDFQQVESGAKITYQAIGSGGRVTQFIA